MLAGVIEPMGALQIALFRPELDVGVGIDRDPEGPVGRRRGLPAGDVTAVPSETLERHPRTLDRNTVTVDDTARHVAPGRRDVTVPDRKMGDGRPVDIADPGKSSDLVPDIRIRIEPPRREGGGGAVLQGARDGNVQRRAGARSQLQLLRSGRHRDIGETEGVDTDRLTVEGDTLEGPGEGFEFLGDRRIETGQGDGRRSREGLPGRCDQGVGRNRNRRTVIRRDGSSGRRRDRARRLDREQDGVLGIALSSDDPKHLDRRHEPVLREGQGDRRPDRYRVENVEPLTVGRRRLPGGLDRRTGNNRARRAMDRAQNPADTAAALHRNRRRVLGRIVDHRGVGDDPGARGDLDPGGSAGDVGLSGDGRERPVFLPALAGNQGLGELSQHRPVGSQQFDTDRRLSIRGVEQTDIAAVVIVFAELRQVGRLPHTDTGIGRIPVEKLSECSA